MAATLRAVASATGQGVSITCDKPTGTLEGDLMIAFHVADAGTMAAMGTPTGGATWQLLGTEQWVTGEPGTKVWWKTAGSSEPATYGFSQGSSADGAVAVAAITTPVIDEPVIESSASNTSGTSVPTPSITPATSDDLEFRWAASKGQSGATLTWTPPATYTERADRQSNMFTSATLASKTLTSGAVSGVQNFTLSTSTNAHMGVTVAIAGTPFFPPRPIVIGQAVQRAAFI